MTNLNNNQKKKLFSLFENLNKDENTNKFDKNINSDILLIDGNNTFIRSYCVNPAMDDNGDHIGGIDGFFKSIGYAIRTLKPTRCVIVFDGQGGSKKRQAVYKNYKAKRKSKIRLNRIYEDSSDDGDVSLLNQLQKAAVLCHNLPVSMMAIENIEADDSIAYLCTEIFNKEDTDSITIMSTDQDFYQLINDKVKVYSPSKKRMYGPKEVFDETGITSKNYILYKILNGDKSDNVDGVKGIGIKTAIKAFPQLSTEEEFTLSDMMKYAKDNQNGKLKAYNLICENEQIIERNHCLMQLGESDISSFVKLKIQDIINKKIDPMNTFEFTSLLKKYRLFSAACFKNHHVWLRETFDTLDFYAKSQ